MAVLVILIGAFLMNGLMEKLYGMLWNRNLDVKIAFQNEPAYEGEDASLTETITNKKRLFLPVLSVGFQVHRNLVFADGENASVSDLSYKRDIFSVGSYQKITRTISFQCKKRGYYELDKIELITRSPFMIRKFYDTLSCPDSIYVFPGNVSLKKAEIPFQKIMGSVVMKKNLYEDPFEFRGIREYQTTDPMNKINWKASARSDQWMVNLYDSTCAQEIRIFLDLEEETIWKFDEIHEEGIRVAAALTEKCISNGIPTGFLTNGRDCKSKKRFSVKPGTGPQQIQLIREALARIDLTQTAEKMSPLLDHERETMEKTSCTYIMIAKNQQMEKYEKMRKLALEGASVIWISTLYEDLEQTLPKNGEVQVLYWEVPK